MGILESDQSGFIYQLFRASYSQLTGMSWRVNESFWNRVISLPSLLLYTYNEILNMFFEFLMKEHLLPYQKKKKKSERQQ